MWYFLIFINFGHYYVNGTGTVFYKACYYDNIENGKGGTNGSWYDRRYVVHPDAHCPQKFYDA